MQLEAAEKFIRISVVRSKRKTAESMVLGVLEVIGQDNLQDSKINFT